MSEASTNHVDGWLHDTAGRTFSRAQKLWLLAGVLLAAAVAWLSREAIDSGAIQGFSASVLQHGSPQRGAIAVAVAVLAGCVVTLLLGRRVRPDAPLFCAALGLLIFRFEGSETKYALLMADGRPAFRLLGAELALLSAALFASFVLLKQAVTAGIFADDPTADGCTLEIEKVDQKLLCTLTVAVVMTAAMMILCQSDRPGQTLWSVFLSAMGATWCAFRFIPVCPSAWYWSGVLLAGMAGYGYAYFYGYQDAAIGVPGGMLAALARPMPLDYASVGVAGSLIGYWVGRKQLRERQEQIEAEAAAS